VEHVRLAPGEAFRAGGEHPVEARLRVLHIRSVALTLDEGRECRPQCFEVFRVRLAPEQPRDRDRRRGVPELVEGIGHGAHARAVGEHVQVAERDLPRLEILIADVASAEDGRLVVGDESLVVHAPVQAREVADHAEVAEASIRHRVEEPDLDVGVRVQREEDVVVRLRADVVDKDAHAHAAVGRSQ